MSERRSRMHSEDLELEESGAESVIGGAGTYKSHGGGIDTSHMTMSQAIRAGYQPITCERNGVTLMRNMRTGREILVQ